MKIVPDCSQLSPTCLSNCTPLRPCRDTLRSLDLNNVCFDLNLNLSELSYAIGDVTVITISLRQNIFSVGSGGNCPQFYLPLTFLTQSHNAGNMLSNERRLQWVVHVDKSIPSTSSCTCQHTVVLLNIRQPSFWSCKRTYPQCVCHIFVSLLEMKLYFWWSATPCW